MLIRELKCALLLENSTSLFMKEIKVWTRQREAIVHHIQQKYGNSDYNGLNVATNSLLLISLRNGI